VVKSSQFVCGACLLLAMGFNDLLKFSLAGQQFGEALMVALPLFLQSLLAFRCAAGGLRGLPMWRVQQIGRLPIVTFCEGMKSLFQFGQLSQLAFEFACDRRQVSRQLGDLPGNATIGYAVLAVQTKVDVEMDKGNLIAERIFLGVPAPEIPPNDTANIWLGFSTDRCDQSHENVRVSQVVDQGSSHHQARSRLEISVRHTMRDLPRARTLPLLTATISYSTTSSITTTVGEGAS